MITLTAVQSDRPSINTTTGRTTGQQRTTPTLYLRDGDRVVLPASFGGRASHPVW